MSETLICPVCYFDLGDQVAVALQCGHCFHQQCLLRAFQLTVVPEEGDPFMRFCPMCRSEVSFPDPHTCPGVILRFSRVMDDDETTTRRIARTRSRGGEEEDDFLGWLNTSLSNRNKQRTSIRSFRRPPAHPPSSDEEEEFLGF